MDNYQVSGRRGKIARITLGVVIVLQFIETAEFLFSSDDKEMAGIASLLLLIAMTVSFVATLFWLHRASRNAHILAEGLSITPGWSVGWFFVPIANLFRPFEAVKETWQASEDPANWHSLLVPGLLRIWWGCWLVGNFLSNGWLFPTDPDGDRTGTIIGAVGSGLLIVASVSLIRIIGRIDSMQSHAHTAMDVPT